MIRDDTAQQTKGPAETESPQVRRWPYGWVALTLLLIIVALVGAAFMLDRQLKPPVGIDPVKSGTPAVQSTPATTAIAVAPPAGATSSPVGMPSDPLQREIVNGYLHYWDVRIQAYFNLDPSLLPEVMAGAELAREQQQMQDFQKQGKAVKVDVDHHLLLADVAPDRAVVYDEYLNRSVFVDPGSKKEFPTTEPPGTEKVSYDMRKIDGKWKVVDGRQHQ